MNSVKAIYVKKHINKKDFGYYKFHPSYMVLEESKDGMVVGFTYVPHDKPLPHHLQVCDEKEWAKCAILG